MDECLCVSSLVYTEVQAACKRAYKFVGAVTTSRYTNPLKLSHMKRSSTVSVMSREKQRSAFDQVSEFDRGRIVACRNIVDYLSGKSVVVLDKTKQL
ncbi:hypothetical protein TNCV_3086541 [Trichonephila clavipes]|nr:hypothetical protein TNCV_3086541 [Trichonephila clavipes]